MTRALTVTNAVLDGASVALRAVDGVITELGAAVAHHASDEVIDAAGALLLPGLVNGHTHAAMTLFRGYGDDLPLMEWLEEKIWPAEANLTRDDVYWGTRLAVAEMLRTGSVRMWDMYWHADGVAAAVVDGGMRATVSSVVIDGCDPTRGRALRTEILDGLDAATGVHPRVTPSLGPHAVYTVSPETLTWIGEVSRDRGIPIQIHCSETAEEVENCRSAHGVSPVMLLDRCGALTERTVLAHVVFLDDADLECIAERGATVVTNPVSNLKLAVGGVFRAADVRAHQIGIGIGTDGASSNNALDLLADTKVFALIQKHGQGNPAAMPAAEAWATATGQLAPALGQRGVVAVGEPADFVLVPAGITELGPGDLVTNLVYAASGAVVDTVVVDGEVRVRHGRVDGEDEVRARAFAAARRVGVR